MNQGRLRSRIRAALTSAAILLPALAVTATTPITASASTTRMISGGGVTFFAPTAQGSDTGAGVQTPEIRPSTEAPGGPAGPDVVAGGAAAEGTGDSGGGGRTVANMSLTFQGLYHRQQRFANGGNQFSVEPPDQGLCAGNGFVLETVNDVMRVFDTAGNPVSGVQDLNTFYHYAPAIVRGNPNVFGPFVTDPSCYYDPATQRWFHVVLTLEVGPTSGHFLGPNHLDIAVSQTANPTLGWNIYRVAVQDDGTAGTPDHGCTTDLDANGNPIGHGPCLGDYPHLGLDTNGFYVSTNEYSFFGFDFHGAQIYAFSKRALESGAPSVAVTQIDTHGLDDGNSGFTLAPSTSRGGAENGARNTEYFLSSNGTDEAHGNGVAVSVRTSNEILAWTLSNTQSLNSSTPNLELTHQTLRVDRYSNPPASAQKVGSTPLADCLNDTACATTFLLGTKDPFVPPCSAAIVKAGLCGPEVEYALDSSDSRMLQTSLAAGKLWGALDTKLNGKAGIEWFQVSVGGDEPRLAKDGYLGLRGQNLTYPAIGVNAEGNGVMAFTVLGSNYFPSAGFATIDRHGTGKVQIAKLGVGPADGFSGYKAENLGGIIRPRWGDYGATATVGNTIWIASEMINQTCTLAQYEAAPFGSCQEPTNPAFTWPDAGTRTTLANWSTEITKINVSSSHGGDNNN
jgi:hypothetical protein